ncbi:beta-propeller fold lactonase family protein [Telmatobacter bradus]|uniref:beta-propeller fold lactonase family protein n=1 Tax=Telmatobacter bradus TaxID=474953 RepID=UPI003B43CE72
MNSRLRCAALLSAGAILAITLSGCRPHDFPQYPANYREYAYVTNGGSATVSVFDVVNLRLDRELAVGQNPVAVAANPKNNEVYVVSSGTATGSGSLAVIDSTKNAVIATIPLEKQPVSITLDAEGKFAYVTNAGSNQVSMVDLKARATVARIAVGEQPAMARLAPDGKTLVVVNRGSNSVSLIDPATRTVRATFTGCPGAAEATILQDSSKAFVACAGGHQVMVLQLARTAHAATAKEEAVTTRLDHLEALLDVGRQPVHLALKPDGGEIFASNQAADTVSEIYDSSDEVGDTYTIGDGPVQSIVSPDNSLLYVANGRSQYVTIYSIDDGKRRGAVQVGDGPVALAFSQSGNLLLAVDQRSGDVALIRTATRSLFTLLPAGRDPNAIALKAFNVQ